MSNVKGYAVAVDRLPENYPTHLNGSDFWESLGRLVATFGFLENVLLRCIFVFTGTGPIEEEKSEEELKRWIARLERSLSDNLNPLIDTFQSSVKANPNSTINSLEELVRDLRKVAEIRNVVCHGCWSAPDQDGRSVPFFVNRKNEVFESAIDVAWLKQTQKCVLKLACDLINTVTHMGYQFPGTNGPGKSLL
jgi:hypothetical protein